MNFSWAVTRRPWRARHRWPSFSLAEVERLGRVVRLADLGEFLGRPIEGPPDTMIQGVAALDQAGPRDLAFVRSDRFEKELLETRAGAVLVSYIT